MASASEYVFENPCPNEWHDYSYGVKRESIRAYLTCPECPQARHYEIARLAQRGAAMVVVDIDARERGLGDRPRPAKPRFTAEFSAMLQAFADAGAEANDRRKDEPCG